MYEQDRFVVRLRQRLTSERAIIGAWFTGSFGRSNPDPYSDLNIALLYSDDAARDGAWQRRHDFCQNILAYVAAQSIDRGPFQHSVLFDTGTLAHFRFESQATITPQWRDREIKVLKETPDGWVAQHQQRSQFSGQQAGEISAETLRALDTQFWVHFWDVYRQVRRGQPNAAFASYINLLANTIPPFLNTLPPEHPAHQQLIGAHFSLDSGQTLAHLNQLLTAYKAARDAVIARSRLSFSPNSSFERNIERALKK